MILPHTIIEPPATTPASYADAKAHLRLDDDHERPLVLALIAAATAHAEGTTRRAIMARTVEIVWPRGSGSGGGGTIQAPIGPLREIVAANGQAPLPQAQPGDYEFAADAAGPTYAIAHSRHGSADHLRASGLVPTPLTIAYRAGMAEDPADVPADLKLAILLHVAHLYRNREATTDRAQHALAHGLDAIYARHRAGGPLT